ncbi:hypothetical protein FACS189431_5380 [Alphaproteobacteria bacterium]|nr:hypothetical protein FACS189431_5380 [Alphaproteobacteria bacterium]
MTPSSKNHIRSNCLELHSAYKNGLLGNQTMPEDTHPKFERQEECLSFFTLPMALNYQRNSYKLWEAATKTFEDIETKVVFDVAKSSKMSQQELQEKLAKYKLALQPNKHTGTWARISQTIFDNWGTISGMLVAHDYDFLRLQKTIQQTHKKGFPCLSGPKIFHYWSYILGEYGGVKLKNKEFIEIAPDTHVIQCSAKLGIITEDEAKKLGRDEISVRWREVLAGTELSPIDMHSPLWFWSRNGFTYKLRDVE